VIWHKRQHSRSQQHRPRSGTDARIRVAAGSCSTVSAAKGRCEAAFWQNEAITTYPPDMAQEAGRRRLQAHLHASVSAAEPMNPEHDAPIAALLPIYELAGQRINQGRNRSGHGLLTLRAGAWRWNAQFNPR
jgi:hypothetical protein